MGSMKISQSGRELDLVGLVGTLENPEHIHVHVYTCMPLML